MSDSLREAKRNGATVKLLTRPPKEERLQYHKILKDEGINLAYNSKVHAKLIVIDRAIAINQ
jgi:phosphatidylserine/phosphatidylglycerophosphate/cardiolipin synthase-like enzyme